jgi:RNA polymerase sigma factor (sigma-70 family)
MTHRDAFLQAIHQDPEDNTHRLVLADWLDENGQSERAEFIRTQVELARLSPDDPRHPELAACEQQLLARYEAAWGELYRPRGSSRVAAALRRAGRAGDTGLDVTCRGNSSKKCIHGEFTSVFSMEIQCLRGQSMASPPLADVLHYLCGCARVNDGNEPSDGQLLRQFALQRDEAAFAALLRRHGPLVFRVCRQALRDTHDSEDVFQATFLVLARTAASIRKPEALAAWLHRVAVNLARTVRSNAARRRRCETHKAALSGLTSPAAEPSNDWQPLLHEEINRLPEKYRLPVVLCCLESHSHEAAARRLGWPVGTVKGRLARARDLLRSRLLRRGLALSGGAALVAPTAVPAAVPEALAEAVRQAALPFATGEAPAATAVSAAAVLLTKGALQTMVTNRLTLTMVFVLLAVALGAGGVLLAPRLGGAEPPREQPKPQTPDAPATRPAESSKKEKYEGMAESTAVVVDGIAFQAIMDRRVRLPAVGSRWPMQATNAWLDLGLRVSNTTDKALVFYPALVRFTVTLPDGTPLHKDSGTDPESSRSPYTVEPGKTLTVPGNASFQWTADGKTLMLHGQETSGYYRGRFWSFEDFKPGKYLLSAEYTLEKSPDKSRPVWLGKVKTETVAFEVIESRAGLNESKAVRAGGVDFQTVVEPKRPAPAPGGRQFLDLGFGITNSTDKPLLFNLYDTLQPVLKSADGKSFQRELRRLRTSPALPVLAGPGRTETALSRAVLVWEQDGKTLRLSGPDGSFGTWYFEGLQPGKYLLSFEYANTEESLKSFLEAAKALAPRGRPKPLEKGQSYWVGSVTTEAAEFEIAAP